MLNDTMAAEQKSMKFCWHSGAASRAKVEEIKEYVGFFKELMMHQTHTPILY